MADPNALLPTGMMDKMADEAEREAAVCHDLQSIFAGFGYRLVNPPLLEYEETLLAEGAGKALSTNTFRLMDPVSQRMMALRSDTTAQMARLSASRLADQSRPLRLCYITDVFRIKSTQLRPERQYKQAGCEMVGAGDATEIALIALNALDRIGVKNITIDFAAPDIIRSLTKNTSDREAIIKACEQRNRAAFERLGKTGQILLALDEISGPAKDFKNRKNKSFPKEISAILDRLDQTIKELSDAVKAYGMEKNITISVDPVETRGFEYQSFPGFTLFAKGISGELGRGGAYNSQFGDNQEPACGFTLYMDSVMRAVNVKKSAKRILLSDKNGWKDALSLQSKGYHVIRFAGTATKDAAHKYDANHFYKNGKIEKI